MVLLLTVHYGFVTGWRYARAERVGIGWQQNDNRVL
jgi:hypothetical protein